MTEPKTQELGETTKRGPGRPPKDGEHIREFKCGMLPSEHAAAIEAARERGISFSELVRKSVAGWIGKTREAGDVFTDEDAHHAMTGE